MSVGERIAAVNRQLDAAQKTRAGAVLTVLGVLLIALVTFVDVGSDALLLVLGAIGVLLLAAGVLAVGTARRDGPRSP
jgi:peptidoglycan/LPS O-acetylase OafA/YrhL